MINDVLKRNERRKRRMMHVRKGVRGTAEKPRLTVFRSNKHLFAQLIDDDQGITLASAGTVMKDFRQQNLGCKSKDAARQIGLKLAEVAKQKNVQHVVFDRGHQKYHGLLALVADAARESGLQF